MPLDAPVTIASLRWLMSELLEGLGLALLQAGFEYDLGEGVLVVVPVLVHVRRVLNARVVRDEEGRVDLPLHDHFEQRPGVLLHMSLAGLDGQPLFHNLAKRKLVREPAVNTRDRDASALAASENSLAKCVRTFGAEEGVRLHRVDDIVDGEAMAFHADAIDH